VFRAGLTNINRGEEAVISAIEENMMDVEPTVEKRINSLWSLANIATLFGLLGTILGLIHTFSALDRVTDPGARQQALARGISEAMNNTALGLGIAVGCMVAHLLLSEWKKRILGDLELNVSKLQNLLTIGRPQG
jgi:biopolymer transport protein ExbB